MTIWTAAFWKALAERVLSTFVQAFGGALLAALIDASTSKDGISWNVILLGAALAGGLAVLKNLFANAVTKTGPSLTNSEQVVPPEPQPVEHEPERALDADGDGQPDIAP